MKHISITYWPNTTHIACVRAFCALWLRPFLLWVGNLGLTHYLSRTLLRGQSIHKTNIPKERQQITNAYTHTHTHTHTHTLAYVFRQKDQLEKQLVYLKQHNINNGHFAGSELKRTQTPTWTILLLDYAI